MPCEQYFPNHPVGELVFVIFGTVNERWLSSSLYGVVWSCVRWSKVLKRELGETTSDDAKFLATFKEKPRQEFSYLGKELNTFLYGRRSRDAARYDEDSNPPWLVNSPKTAALTNERMDGSVAWPILFLVSAFDLLVFCGMAGIDGFVLTRCV